MAGSKRARPGYVRIIGGAWRRRRISIAGQPGPRPTPDRVRETLFNWLAPVLPGALCLDLYAGTGALGFEALSRGAASAVLVERDPRLAESLERVRDELGAEARVVCADASDWLERSHEGPFDIAFVDPPYADAVDELLGALSRRLQPGASVYLERERGSDWPEVTGIRWTRRGHAGGVDFGLGAIRAD